MFSFVYKTITLEKRGSIYRTLERSQSTVYYKISGTDTVAMTINLSLMHYIWIKKKTWRDISEEWEAFWKLQNKILMILQDMQKGASIEDTLNDTLSFSIWYKLKYYMSLNWPQERVSPAHPSFWPGYTGQVLFGMGVFYDRQVIMATSANQVEAFLLLLQLFISLS